MEHHGIPMPPDPDSPLKGKVDQLKKIESKLSEISSEQTRESLLIDILSYSIDSICLVIADLIGAGDIVKRLERVLVLALVRVLVLVLVLVLGLVLVLVMLLVSVLVLVFRRFLL